MGSVSERRKIARRGGGSVGGGREEGSIFKATAIFDSYSPGLWFWRHLFPDPSSASTHFSPLSPSFSLLALTYVRTYVHTHTRVPPRERGIYHYRYHYGRLRSTGNCTMPADTPPISEHRLRSTPSLCSTLLSSNLSKSIATSVHDPFHPKIFSFLLLSLSPFLIPSRIRLNSSIRFDDDDVYLEEKDERGETARKRNGQVCDDGGRRSGGSGRERGRVRRRPELTVA